MTYPTIHQSFSQIGPQNAEKSAVTRDILALFIYIEIIFISHLRLGAVLLLLDHLELHVLQHVLLDAVHAVQVRVERVLERSIMQRFSIVLDLTLTIRERPDMMSASEGVMEKQT